MIWRNEQLALLLLSTGEVGRVNKALLETAALASTRRSRIHGRNEPMSWCNTAGAALIASLRHPASSLLEKRMVAGVKNELKKQTGPAELGGWPTARQLQLEGIWAVAWCRACPSRKEAGETL